MSKWKGSLISASATVPSGTAYTGKANGKWSIQDQIQAKQDSLWAKGVGKPSTPAIGTASIASANAGGMTASVGFTPSSDMGVGSGTLNYTAVSNPGNYTGSGASSPLSVTGLTNGVNYTFTVSAANSLAYISDSSAASSPIGTTVPAAPTIGTATSGAGVATVTFTAPSNTGGLPITGYTAVSTPGSITGTGTSSPIVVSGLTNGTSYTFKVSASNLLGSGVQSSASNSVTPSAAIRAIASGDNTNTGAQAFAWNNGLGTKFTAKPDNLNSYSSVTFSSQTTAGIPSSLIAVTSSSSSLAGTKGIYVYDWGNGFGAKYADLTSTGLEISIAKFNADNSAIIASNGYTSPRILAYAWNAGFGTKFADPSTLPTAGNSRGLEISLNGSLVALSSTSSPFVYVYPWSVSGFGTKFANPATLPADQSYGSYFSRTGNYIAVCNNYQGIGVYPWNAGFGTKYADPTVIGTLDSNRFAKFTANDGAIIANNGALCYAIRWSAAGFGTKYTNPTGLATTAFYSSIAVSRENADLVAIAPTVSPFMQVFPWDNTTGWGSVYANPSTLPGSNSSFGIDFNF